MTFEDSSGAIGGSFPDGTPPWTAGTCGVTVASVSRLKGPPPGPGYRVLGKRARPLPRAGRQAESGPCRWRFAAQDTAFGDIVWTRSRWADQMTSRAWSRSPAMSWWVRRLVCRGRPMTMRTSPLRIARRPGCQIRQVP